MDEGARIEMRVSYDRELWRRGMRGWWRSVVPPEPFAKRVVFWAVVWLLVFGAAMLMPVLGLSPWYVAAALIGAGIIVAAVAYLQRSRMGAFWDEIERHWQRTGEMRLILDEAGVLVRDAAEHRTLGWAGVDAVYPVEGGHVLRSGISMIIIPDKALPDGITPEMLTRRIGGWRAGAAR